MEMRQLRYFVAVAEKGNFSAASRSLYVSQPPITRQIQQLEAELGVRLFERTRKGAVLTPAGRAFLDEAWQILTRARLAAERSRAAALGEIGCLDIGYFGSAIYSIIPRLVRAFRDRSRDATVSLMQMPKAEQVEAIKGGRIHIGFARYFPSDPEVSMETVVREKVVLAVATEHPLAQRPQAAPQALATETLILFPKSGRPGFADEVLRILGNCGLTLQREHQATDISSALALAAAGFGVCPAPESVTQINWPDLRFLELQGVDALSSVNCIYSTHSRSPILLRFLEVLRNKSAAHPPGPDSPHPRCANG